MRIQSLYDLHRSFPDIDGIWNLQNLVETEGHIRSLLPEGQETASASQIEAMTQAVRLFSLQKKFSEAKEYLVLAKRHLDNVPKNLQLKPQVRYYLEEGRYHCLTMCPTRALDSFRKAWEILNLQSGLDHFVIDAAYMISITLPVKQGKEWFGLALEMADKAEENSLSSKWRPILFLQAGWQAYDRLDFDAALKFFDRAGDSLIGENLIMTRIIMWSRARVLRDLGSIEEAKKIQEKIYMEFTVSGESNGHVYLELAECYQTIQKPDEAKMFFELAYEKLKDDKWYSENFSARLSEIQKKIKLRKNG